MWHNLVNYKVRQNYCGPTCCPSLGKQFLLTTNNFLLQPMLRHTLKALVFILFFPVCLQAQYTIRGVVTDAETGETLPFANVFFAETTYGVSTDSEGRYVLNVTDPGTYDLIARFVGYQTYAISIRISEERDLRLDMALKPEEVNLGSVVVTAKKDKDWERYMVIFKELFLGYSANAAKCKILNEQAIDFYFDKKSNTLYAFAEEAIKVENKGLGYMLEYYLEDFSMNYSSMLSLYYGYTVFTEMKPRSKRQLRRWEENREIAYKGSLQHFFASAFKGRLEEEGYIIQEAKDIKGGRVLNPNPMDLSGVLRQGQSQLSVQLPFENYLYVTYTREGQSEEFRQFNNPSGLSLSVSATRVGEQVSWISLVEGKKAIEFESSGYVYDPISFITQGYWGFEKVADMVPINYKPRQ